MQAIITAAGQVFNMFFVGSETVDPYIEQVIDLVVGNDYLLLGVGLLLAGTAISYLSRLIHTT